MMKNITMLEKKAPTPTSIFRLSISSRVAPCRLRSIRRPMAFSSSTSCEDCQKKRYGEIVVPRMATSVPQPWLSLGIEGMKASRRRLPQSGPTWIAVMT
jgi:hypothetical protein